MSGPRNSPASAKPALRALAAAAMFSTSVSVTLLVPLPTHAAGNSDAVSPAAQNLDYQAGMEAIQVSDWDRAIANLNVALVALPTNADLQNWLGFAYRNTGKYDEALEHFRAALDLDPAHRRANEYAGETYLLKGNKTKAREYLATLGRICGKQCDEYVALQKAIAIAK
jgi:tetratricopeptide (TPR) repeat protein